LENSVDTVTVYRPVALGLYAVADARDGILRLFED
jgi:hypothetical protein